MKANREKQPVLDAEADPAIAPVLEDPSSVFEVHRLAEQIHEECVWETDRNAPERWGNYNEQTYSYCLTLVTRINTVLFSRALECVFGSVSKPSIADEVDGFLATDKRLLRIGVDGLSFEFSAREVVANALGRHLLRRAREGALRNRPVLLVVDEAHSFLGRSLGGEETSFKLDAFELIAKEGRKYGLSVCFATQRPRDVTPEVLSQVGTLLVHRMTNDRDRDVVERACGEIDRSVVSFLPNLQPGEAILVGVDFPVPLTIQVREPATRPRFQGARYQISWATTS